MLSTVLADLRLLCYLRSLLTRKHFIILAIVILPSISAGADIELYDTQSRYIVGKHLEYLVDTTGLLSIEDVTTPENASRFITSDQAVLNFGFTSSVYWLRLTLHNNAINTSWLLEQRFANTHFLDLYIPATDISGYQISL